jgi:hypothetical protein
MKGALIGAGVGATIGLAVGGDSTSAVIGGLIGGALGGLTGYLISKDVQEQKAQDRLKTYNTSMDYLTNNLNSAVAHAQAASKCYLGEYNTLKKRIQSGQTVMSKPEKAERLAEMRSGNNEAIAILQTFKQDTSKNQNEFKEVVRLEQARTADKLPPKQVQAIERRSAAHDKAAQNLDNELAILADNSKIIQNDIDNVDLASKDKKIAQLDKLRI